MEARAALGPDHAHRSDVRKHQVIFKSYRAQLVHSKALKVSGHLHAVAQAFWTMDKMFVTTGSFKVTLSAIGVDWVPEPRCLLQPFASWPASNRAVILIEDVSHASCQSAMTHLTTCTHICPGLCLQRVCTLEANASSLMSGCCLTSLSSTGLATALSSV